MAWFSLLQSDVARTWKNAVCEYTGEGLGDLVHMVTSSGHTGVGTRTLFFFFPSYYFILKFFFWFPIFLWIFTFYSHYSPWLGYVCSIEGLARLDVGRGDSVDVDLMYSTESTRVGKSWGTKMVKQRRLTDDRVRLD